MGNIKMALHLITDKLRNVDQAIEFCNVILLLQD